MAFRDGFFISKTATASELSSIFYLEFFQILSL